MTSKKISNSKEFNNIISLNNGRVAIIDFHAEWSGCSTQFSEFLETFKLLGVDFYSVNVDQADDAIVLEADVRVVPTFMVFKGGNKVGYAEGVGAGNLHNLVGSHVAGWGMSRHTVQEKSKTTFEVVDYVITK